MTVAGEMLVALRAGRKAARTRQSPANPYARQPVTSQSRTLARMWRLGYQGANPVPDPVPID